VTQWRQTRCGRSVDVALFPSFSVAADTSDLSVCRPPSFSSRDFWFPACGELSLVQGEFSFSLLRRRAFLDESPSPLSRMDYLSFRLPLRPESLFFHVFSLLKVAHPQLFRRAPLSVDVAGWLPLFFGRDQVTGASWHLIVDGCTRFPRAAPLSHTVRVLVIGWGTNVSFSRHEPPPWKAPSSSSTSSHCVAILRADCPTFSRSRFFETSSGRCRLLFMVIPVF